MQVAHVRTPVAATGPAAKGMNESDWGITALCVSQPVIGRVASLLCLACVLIVVWS